MAVLCHARPIFELSLAVSPDAHCDCDGDTDYENHDASHGDDQVSEHLALAVDALKLPLGLEAGSISIERLALQCGEEVASDARI